ncbi:MAG: hypothetical protein RL330_265 [Actinomycetota bacterium]|jgi:biotin transport system substrate-specific component
MTSLLVAPRTLADLVPLRRHRTVALVTGTALLTAAAAQIHIPLGFTPVPVTAQTLVVLLAAAALGARLAVAGQALYWMLGAIGLPFYAGAERGWDAATGSTFGYFVGFVVASAVVGRLAERGQDRSFSTSVPAMLTGSALIYACGVSWLAVHLDVPFYAGDGRDAFTYGLAPFIAGDLAKMIAAAALTPVLWRVASRSDLD